MRAVPPRESRLHTQVNALCVSQPCFFMYPSLLLALALSAGWLQNVHSPPSPYSQKGLLTFDGFHWEMVVF